MVDAILGKWKASAEDMTGMKEYLDASKPELMAAYYKNYTSLCSKIAENHYRFEHTIEGLNEEVNEDIVIGRKSIQHFVGFGSAEVDTVLEGNKIVCTANIDGVQVKNVFYMDGDCFVGETHAKGATLAGRHHRA